jgi:hypothetical protein
MTHKPDSTGSTSTQQPMIPRPRPRRQRLLDDELTFVDAPRSSVFIADEHIIF